MKPYSQDLTTNATTSECVWHHARRGVTDEEDVKDFMRAELALCVITVLLIFMSAGFSVYSLLHPRYTFKRIAGAVHVLVGLMLIVLMEMVKSEAHLAAHRVGLAGKVLAASGVWYGYSYLLSCVVCLIFFVAALAFFANSRKRKMLPFDLETNFH